MTGGAEHGDGRRRSPRNVGMPAPPSELTRQAWGLRLLLWIAVFVAFCAFALPLYPQTRLIVGALSLMPLMWVPGQLVRLAQERERASQMLVRRKYMKLRSLTGVILDEVRRLNGLSVDVQRGVRDPETTEREVRAIETRLHSLVNDLRSAAGVEQDGAASLHGAAMPPEPASAAAEEAEPAAAAG